MKLQILGERDDVGGAGGQVGAIVLLDRVPQTRRGLLKVRHWNG